MDRESKISLSNFINHPDFHLFKRELDDYIKSEKEDLLKIDTSSPTFGFEAGVKIEAINKIENFFVKLGVLKNIETKKISKTYE